MKLTIGDLIPHGGGPPPASSAWDPANANAAFTLSGGNLIATHDAVVAGKGVVGSLGKAGGQWYFEVRHSVDAFCNIGLADNTYANGGSLANAVDNSYAYWPTASAIVHQSAAIIGMPGGAANDFYCVAVDLTARLAWWRIAGNLWNNSGTANPATGVGGVPITPVVTYFPAASCVTASALTLNIGGSAFAGAVPAGYSAWG